MTGDCVELTVFVGVPGSLCKTAGITLFPILTTLPKTLTHVVDRGGEEVRPEELVSVQVVRQTPTAAASAVHQMEHRGAKANLFPFPYLVRDISLVGTRGMERYRNIPRASSGHRS